MLRRRQDAGAGRPGGSEQGGVVHRHGLRPDQLTAPGHHEQRRSHLIVGEGAALGQGPAHRGGGPPTDHLDLRRTHGHQGPRLVDQPRPVRGLQGLRADAEARLARAIEAQLANVAERLPEGRIPVVADDGETEPTVELTAETEGEGEAAGEITVNDRIPSQGVPEYSVVLRPSGPHLIQPGVPLAIQPAGGSGGAVAEPMPQRPSQRAASWRHRAGADAAPMPASAAIARLDQCEERDEIFEVIARGARSRLDYVAVLTTQGGTASGRLALEGDSFDVSRVAQVGVPLEAPSALRTAHETASPYIGPLVADDRAQAALYALGGARADAGLAGPRCPGSSADGATRGDPADRAAPAVAAHHGVR